MFSPVTAPPGSAQNRGIGTFRKGTIVTIYSKRQRYEWRRRTRRLVWRVNLLLAMAVALLVLILADMAPVQASTRCPGGGRPDGAGRCVYVNPMPGYLDQNPLRVCSTKLVAGVPVRSCRNTGNLTAERRGW